MYVQRLYSKSTNNTYNIVRRAIGNKSFNGLASDEHALAA